jgi:penicillin-binding protein 2
MKRASFPKPELAHRSYDRPILPNIAGLLGALAAVLFPLCTVEAAEVTVDRHGVVLHSSKPGGNAEFPYRALAAQLLDALASVTGDKLTLTIDSRVQFVTEEALRAVPRGAAVVLDAQTGEILAMASVPSFDPNGLTPERRTELKADPTAPLSNRAIQAFAPGSTFMPVTALAGASKGLSAKKFSCTGSVTYGNKVMSCWISLKGGGHGELTVDGALKDSCGPFFYQLGNAAGIDACFDMGKLLGLGSVSGLGLPDEKPGILPNPAWLREISPNERWSAGYTANTAIGQGFILATPLQMARVAATIGNGGSIPPLRLRLDAEVTPSVELEDHGVTREALEPIRRGMRRVVEEGTGKRAQVAGIAVAGKTGTAQYWREQNQKDNHTWFIAYAPAEAPTIAVAVVVQGAKSGGGVAAPIAARIIERFMRAELPEAKALDPAKGSFDQVEEVR